MHSMIAILQARFSSSRLPGKVLEDILGEPMIFRQIERALRSGRIEGLIVATSSDVSDDPLADMCRRKGIECFRGNLDDVLDRFYHSALQCGPDHIVRITGDCPLLDPDVMDRIIEKHFEDNFDYTSNTAPPTFPDGLDVEVFRFSALADAWREAKLPSEREHVTPYIRNNPDRYRMGNLLNGEDLSSLRWTVDEKRDLDFVRRVYEYLHPEKPAFGMKDVLNLLKQKPELMEINGGIARNEGYFKSLREDADLAAEEG